MIMTAVGLIATIAITLLLASVITPSFTKLEDKAIAGHVARARVALSDYAAKVESAVRDYGDWTDSYVDMADANEGFDHSRFLPVAMRNIGVDGMAYISPLGRTVIAGWQDAAGEPRAKVQRQRLRAMIARTDLATALGPRSSGRFYARIGNSVAAIGVARVRRPDGRGRPRGYVLMARVITAPHLSTLLQAGARIDIMPRGDVAAVTRESSKVTIAVPLIGADGHAVADARFSVPRDVSLLGRHMLIFAVAGSTMVLLLVLLVLRRLIERLVLRPLHRVESHMQRVRLSGSLALLDEDGRRDEVGSLGRSFNAMLRQLKDLREQIEVQSFDLGRSESAVAVMHNVSNALNPISTILSQGIVQSAAIDRATLDRAIAELARGDIPAARRGKLAALVAAAIEAESADREARRRELIVGREAMADVLEIIGQQQKAAHERPALELCDVSDIIARNATIVRYSLGASIAFSFPAGPSPVMASRVILSQVIANIFGNAVESIAARGTGSGSIVATITEANGRVTIAVRDDGEGFSPQAAAMLFQRGFSTRAHKSGGLGLHWCANSMAAMKGTLRLESDGPGLGAVAILTLDAGDRAQSKAA
ncbi:CHASE4 domain-containing protein [Sphingomonas faeni]|uniref:CHASE4 domain-containing protein n=1 Tax=Sphingomonas faeni TaxID=185950 RepID=UPI0020C12F5E|nr:CHASE4 domain-containing protein [Sphingomonas faeni]MCK8456956.1 ATP-binding protein [Sphingomonas faeni]